MQPDEHLEQLRELYRVLRKRIRTNWHRSVPFADQIVDRWERAAYLGFGEGASVYDSCLILGEVRVGEHTWIGPFTVLDGSGGELEIGAFCSISAGVQIYTHDTVQWSLTGGKAAATKGPVSIGNRCYIGPNTVIAKGVTIGDRCVIGANSFVSKDIPTGSKAWGTPCRIVSRQTTD